jgi:hypothetical protein
MSTKISYCPFSANSGMWGSGIAITNDTNKEEAIVLYITDGATGKEERREINIGPKRIKTIKPSDLPKSILSIKMESSEKIYLTQLQQSVDKKGNATGFGTIPPIILDGNLGN